MSNFWPPEIHFWPPAMHFWCTEMHAWVISGHQTYISGQQGYISGGQKWICIFLVARNEPMGNFWLPEIHFWPTERIAGGQKCTYGQFVATRNHFLPTRNAFLVVRDAHIGHFWRPEIHVWPPENYFWWPRMDVCISGGQKLAYD